MSLFFALALIGFFGLAVVYIALRLPDINPRKRFGQTTTEKSKPLPPLQSPASRKRGRYMEIVGRPHTDMSIYFSEAQRKPDRKSIATRHQVEKQVGDQLGVASTSSPLDTSHNSEPSSATDIDTEELARYPSMSTSEQKAWRAQKLDGVSEKQQAVKEAINKLVTSKA